MQNCSLQRRMMLVLIALLFLPVVSALAANNTFRIFVNHPTVGPVASATVYLWDKNNPYNFQMAYTNANGEAQIIIGGFTPTADSLSNPSPNIGVLAIPANGPTGTMAFATGDALFYNFWNEDAIGPDIFIGLNDGCKLTFAPKLDDKGTVTPGMAGVMQVNLPGVPWQVKTFNVYQNDLVNGQWHIVWPFDSVCNYSLGGDNDYGMFDKPSFYGWMSDHVMIARETEKIVEPVNKRQYKGQFSVDTASSTAPFMLFWTQAGDINFKNAVSSPTFIGSASVFLPRGMYNFKFLPMSFEPVVHLPPITVFPAENIGDVPVAKTVAITGGDTVTGVVSLANAGSFSALSDLRIVAQKRVAFGGSDSWLEVETVSPNTTTGAYVFKHRFVTGMDYRILTQNANQYDSKPGIIDNVSVPPRCYAHFNGQVVKTSGAFVFDFTLPQVAAVIVSPTIPTGNANAGFARDPNSNPIKPQAAFVPGPDSEYGVKISDQNMIWNGDKLFIPFVEVGKPFFVRFDYDEDFANLTNPICIKITNLIQADPGITKVVPVAVDPTKFDTISSNMFMANSDGTPGVTFNAGVARAFFTPLIQVDNRMLSVAALLGQWISSGYGLDNKVFTANDTQPFVYKAENGKAFRVSVVEETYPRGLEGFMPFTKDVTLPATDPDPLNSTMVNLVLNVGRSFVGQVMVDGQPQANSTIKVSLNSIFEDNFQANQFYIERSGVVTTDGMGNFRVSGLNPGQYDVDLILDQIDLATSTPMFNVQTMPVINRKIYVDETASAQPSSPTVPTVPTGPTPPTGPTSPTVMPTIITFNLNTAAIGWLDGQIVDEKGQPVAGAKIEIRKKGELKTAMYEGMSYYQRGDISFLCSTNQDGRIVRPAPSADMALIPLENGYYDIFVVGVANPNASFTYEVSNPEAKPLVTVQIFSNNQKTPARITLKRKFPVKGLIKESGNPVKYASCQILTLDGKQVGNFMTNDKGEFGLPDGLPPGKFQFGLVIETETARRFYLQPVEIIADQMNNVALDLVPSSLANVQIQTLDSNGQILPEAPGTVFLFSDPVQGFRAPHWYITWVQSDLRGMINLSLPALTPEQLQASFTYVFQGQQKWVSINDPATNKTINRTFMPPALIPLKLPSTEMLKLTWRAPVNVVVNATNLPAGREGRYLGVLMTNKKFLAGKSLDPHQQTMPGMGEQARDIFFATFNNGKFEFENVVPGPEYVFIALEAFGFLNPEVVEWAYDIPEPAMFRYVSVPFIVNANVVRNEALWPLATLNITCAQAPGILTRPGAVNLYVTPDPVSTVGKPSWPLVMTQPWTTVPPLAFPIEVPASYALRITYTPQTGDSFLGKNYEDFIVPQGGRSLDIVLNELPKVSGSVTFDGQPVSGQLILVPEGADAMAPDFVPVRVPVNVGSFSAFLKPGLYIGYAVPAMGPAKFIEIPMASQSFVLPTIAIAKGMPVKGTVVASGTPLLGASVMVMRKRAARSELTDGQQMWPYLAMQGKSQIPCGPIGDFFFPAEDGVDYYIQPIVPAGFNPGRPVKVSLAGAPATVNITIGQGGMIRGHMNVPGYVEAIPVGKNAFDNQFSATSNFYAEAMIPQMINGVERYPFAIVGLDPNMLYDISFWPMDGSYSFRRFTNVPVPSDPNAPPIKVDLSAGFRITGQLVDASGNPLSAAGVPVNLAMTLAAAGDFYTPIASPTASANYRLMKSVTAESTVDYSLQDSILSGMWTSTNEYGQFTFNNVPPFLNAFIKTDKGFSADGVGYGRARTPNFEPGFVNEVMHFDLVVPVGGKIIGRLINEEGKPVGNALIEAYMGQEWAEVMVGTDGVFSLEGLAPGADYMVSLLDSPGYAPVYRVGVLVEPGKATDLGALVVAKAVGAYGQASGTLALSKRSFAYGMPEGTELIMVAMDGSKALTDEDLLTRKFMQSIVGDSDIYLTPGDEIDETWFHMYAKPGKTNIGVVLHRETKDGIKTLLSWGWRPGVVVPTQEQLEFGAYEITSGTAPIMFPQKFGTIEGSLAHALDASATFNPADAVIAFYPVTASGTEFVLVPTPFPTALTSPVNGRWLVRDIPQGSYRIKVITRKFGAVFMNKIVTIGDTLVKEPLVLGNAVVKVTGRVLVEGTTTPVDSAKVSLVLRGLSTSTGADGKFAFYLPLNDFFLPQLEVGKPGIQTRRILDAGGIATAGVTIATDTDLKDIFVSNAVSSVEVTVKSAKDSKIYVGAEVALVYRESPTTLVWTVGETKTTDENGIARFLSVPSGKQVSFRARAHYHVPTIASTTVAAGLNSLTITMPAAAPKVFYTGVVEPVDANTLRLKASFDFNQVVTKNDVGLLIDNQARIGDCTFPDLIGTRITNMLFNNTVPNKDNLVASVTYTGFGEIGKFEIVGKALFKKAFEVDPLSANGFTGYQTDSSGNKLPTGINVPPGYLDPEIDSFELEVASPTINPDDKLEGTDSPPEFAGPTFSFNFGQGTSNFGAGTATETKGLFEITIAYTEGTKLEPRWYDTTKKTWSKVGIIQDSIKYDYPSKGYVTFKVDHLTEFTVLKNVANAASGLRCDFSGNGKVDDADLMFLLAALQTKGLADLQLATYDVATVKAKAALLYPSGVFTNAILPDSAIDDINGDGKIADQDLMALLGYLQTKGLSDLGLASLDSTTIGAKTKVLMPSFVGTVTKMPGETVTR